eukprot:CAMPEP_0113625296 /NCGR_PEP_ID=MMETSP0017_2-20120614/13066_1 /TAXON_ID=2856 /ORGANISM="Cylindrotheca closterium" /LENGTH=283 /DNA_ID=CAMNT_0000535405 /DNA_START=281 /DNA_END=1129 /DNA_ORIENTATION=+ /assembly_acc=CAM_ASM_000147
MAEPNKNLDKAETKLRLPECSVSTTVPPHFQPAGNETLLQAEVAPDVEALVQQRLEGQNVVVAVESRSSDNNNKMWIVLIVFIVATAIAIGVLFSQSKSSDSNLTAPAEEPITGTSAPMTPSTLQPTSPPTPQHTPPSTTKPCFQSNTELKGAVDSWFTTQGLVETQYGPIGDWCFTAGVTSMSSLFYNRPTFNGDISSWDVSSVTNMWYMFYKTPFNKDLSSWDVSSVTTMYSMFYKASSFNQDLSSWDVSSVIDTGKMFYGASSFNQDLSSWDVSSVRDMW